MRKCYPLVWISLLALQPIAAWAQVRDPAAAGHERARALASAQVSVRQMLVDPALSYPPSALRVEHGPKVSASFRVIRLVAEFPSGAMFFLAAEADSSVVPLGGFEAPRLDIVARLLRHTPVTSGEALRLAHTLALLADPEGARACTYGPRAGPPVESQSSAGPAEEWPTFPDSVIARSNGGFRTRTSISCAAGETPAGNRIVREYAFEFTAGGELLGWTTHTVPVTHSP